MTRRMLLDHLVPLPVWPRELERQFHRWLPQESWGIEEVHYLQGTGLGEPRPCLRPLLWAQFFWWRARCGFGDPQTPNKVIRAVCSVDHRLVECLVALERFGPPDDPAAVLAWAYAPFDEVVVHLDLTQPAHLYHRETLKKLRRLRLLEP